MKKKIIIWVTLLASGAFGSPSKKLLKAIEQVESGGNTEAIGDGGKSVGCLQIGMEVVDDVNLLIGTPDLFKSVDRFSRKKSYVIAMNYLDYWGQKYYIHTGVQPTDEVYARIWNGGPAGYLKKGTLVYWEKVKKEMNK